MGNDLSNLPSIRHDLKDGIMRISFAPLCMTVAFEAGKDIWFQTDYSENDILRQLPILQGNVSFIATLIGEKPIHMAIDNHETVATFQCIIAHREPIIFGISMARVCESKRGANDILISDLQERLADAEARLADMSPARDQIAYRRYELYDLAMNMQFDKVRQLLDSGVPAIQFSSKNRHVIFTLISNNSVFMPRAIEMVTLLLSRMPPGYGPSLDKMPFNEFINRELKYATGSRRRDLITIQNTIARGKRIRSPFRPRGRRASRSRSRSPRAASNNRTR